MKRLYLARHADASWREKTLKDFDRPLSDRGYTEASVMAQELSRFGVDPERIITSPALRARTTAEIYHETLGGILREDERIYDASVTTLLYLVDEAFEGVDTLMIVGHNPGISELVNHLSDTPTDHLRTCSVVGLKWDTETENKQGHRFMYTYPDKVRSA